MRGHKIPKIYLKRLDEGSVRLWPAFPREELKTKCRVWQGATDQKGYGVLHCVPGTMGVPSGIVRTHRLAYWAAHGPFPKSAEIDHKCRQPRCSEAEHLFLRGPTEHALISNADKLKDRYEKLHVVIKDLSNDDSV